MCYASSISMYSYLIHDFFFSVIVCLQMFCIFGSCVLIRNEITITTAYATKSIMYTKINGRRNWIHRHGAHTTFYLSDNRNFMWHKQYSHIFLTNTITVTTTAGGQ